MSVSIEKPERRMSVLDKNYSYTLGGVAQYYAEIAIMSENGYVSTEHSVPDRDGTMMIVSVLHHGDAVVKVYEL